ncbi:MAG: Na+/H+ antiporter NhaA [Bauldia sp.]|nr:Na+/H+ antiporter NhaA [Bauldia sp.]
MVRALERFINHEASGGIILMFAAAFALLLANSPLAWLYEQLLTTPVVVQVGALELRKPLLLWVNDGLMAVFFLLVGLEIKREILLGQLSSRQQLMLPGMAAIGGMLVPSLIYVAVTWGEPELAAGWAIPAATDIAFALGVLALLGDRVPLSLKVFLLALAIVDDLGAIAIIAIFYTSDLSLTMLAGAGAAVIGLIVLNRLHVRRIAPYVLIGIVMWVFVLKSGVHATLAGVALAFAIPMVRPDKGGRSPLEKLEHKLEPWVAYGIMPLFAFANAGVSLAGLTLDSFLQPLPLGILLGLFLGKQLGVFAAAWLTVKTGLARLPEGAGWRHIYGVACIAGVGFTMSLFIGTLAFDGASEAVGVRLGVLAGSLLSALVGYGIIRSTGRRAAGGVSP